MIVLSGAIHFPYAESVLVLLQDQMGGLQCELDKARANCNLKHWWPVESFLRTMIQQCREIRNVFLIVFWTGKMKTGFGTSCIALLR